MRRDYKPLRKNVGGIIGKRNIAVHARADEQYFQPNFEVGHFS